VKSRPPFGTHPPARPLVGREAELERLGGLVRDAGVVTVVGPPGVGKTRLAAEALAELTDGRATLHCSISTMAAG
jgi:MoxR-like ATPase